jgi:hypothetical protein
LPWLRWPWELLALSEAAEPDSAQPEGVAIQRATTFRETFGFPAHRSLVEQAESDANYSSELYGVPLSAAEIVEMQRRIGVERAAQPAVDFASKRSDWAGWYIDQRDKGIPVFMFASGDGDLVAGIADLMPGTRFRVESADRTWEELLETQRRIDQATDRLVASGIDLTMTGIDVRANRVDVGIDGLTADDKVILTKEFGEGLSFRDEAPAVSDACTGSTGTLNCRPIKGGLRMNNSVGGNGCTSGFNVRRSANGAQLAVLTAGHCIAGHPVNTDWNHNGSRFGESKYHTWGPESPADVGIIGIDPDELPTNANRLWLYSASTCCGYDVTYQTPDVYQTASVQACAYGSYSNNARCGVIGPDVNVRHRSPAWGVINYITGTNEYSIDMILGDSGGPIYQILSGTARAALGTHVHSTDGSSGYGWYSPFGRGKSEYAAQTTDSYVLCVTPSC